MAKEDDRLRKKKKHLLFDKIIFRQYSAFVRRFPRELWLLAGVVLIAILLRVWGINFGLPYLYHPDEPRLVTIAQNIFKTGDLNPHFFDYPSLFLYINALTYIPYYLIGKLIGVFHSPSDISAPIIIIDGVAKTMLPTTFLLGRILTVIFGTATVVLIYISGKELTQNSTVGLLAALLLAVSPTHTPHSHYIRPDVYLIFFMLLAFWGSIKAFQHGKTCYYILAGTASGLVASSKYNGIIIIVSLLSSHFIRTGLRGIKDYRLYLALSLCIITFFATTPFALLDYQKFLADLQFVSHVYSTGHAGAEGNTLIFYLSYLFWIEGPITLLAVFKILHGLYTKSKQTIFLATFPVAYFIFINNFVVRNDRTLMPMIPFLYLLSSSYLGNLFRQAYDKQLNRRKWLLLVVGILTTFCLAWPFWHTIQRNIRLATLTATSRETARIWIDHNLPEGARIAIEPYSPYIDSQRFYVQGFSKIIDHIPDWYIDINCLIIEST